MSSDPVEGRLYLIKLFYSLAYMFGCSHLFRTEKVITMEDNHLTIYITQRQETV